MHDYNFGCQNIIQLSKGKMLNQSEEFHSLADGLFLFVCLSGRLPRRKESGCLIRDSASRPIEVLQLESKTSLTQPGLRV